MGHCCPLQRESGLRGGYAGLLPEPARGRRDRFNRWQTAAVDTCEVSSQNHPLGGGENCRPTSDVIRWRGLRASRAAQPRRRPLSWVRADTPPHRRAHSQSVHRPEHLSSRDVPFVSFGLEVCRAGQSLPNYSSTSVSTATRWRALDLDVLRVCKSAFVRRRPVTAIGRMLLPSRAG